MSGEPYAIVFSGGGALGAWEVGCYRSILSRHGGTPPAIVTGASAGAINAVGVCAGMKPKQLEDTWSGLSNSKVYASQFGFGDLARIVWSAARKGSVSEAIGEAAARHRSYYSTLPLEATLLGVLNGFFQDFLQSPISCAISVTNLTRGAKEFYYKLPVGKTLPPGCDANWNSIGGLQLLVQVLMGSTALPVLFPPRESYFDGGVLLNQPISPAIMLGSTYLYVVIPTAEALGATANLKEISSTLVSTWLAMSLQAQLESVRLRNRIRNMTDDPRLKICVIRPTHDLSSQFGVGLLDFGKSVSVLVNDGERCASDRINRFDIENEATWY